MNMQRRKTFAWLLALAMLLALVPVAALAEGQTLSMSLSIQTASGTLSDNVIAETETNWQVNLSIRGSNWEEAPELILLLSKPDGTSESLAVSVSGDNFDSASGTIANVSKTLDGSRFSGVGTYTLTLTDSECCVFVSSTLVVETAATPTPEATATPKPTAKATAKAAATKKPQTTTTPAATPVATPTATPTATVIPFAINNVLSTAAGASGANGKGDVTIALNNQTIRVGESFPSASSYVTITGLKSGDSAPALANAQIEVYDLNGQLVTDSKSLSSGVYTVRWSNMASIKNDSSWTTLSQKYDITWPSTDVASLTITNMHEVSFDLNYTNAPDWSSKTVIDGYALQEPTYAPTRSGYTFAGWYTEAECTNAYDFSTPVTSDFTLYARWRKGESNGGSTTSPETGDPNYLVIWLAAAAVFGLCTILLVANPRKRRGIR